MILPASRLGRLSGSREMTLPLHLSKKDKINLGSFYTADFLVNEVFAMLRKYVDYKECVLLDSSCGSGNFLRAEAISKGGFSKNSFSKIIGVDIDKTAIQIAQDRLDSKVALLCKNALSGMTRADFDIAESDRLIMVGNPPYNDRTSIVQQRLKNKDSNPIDLALQARDIGISFLRSYERLGADFICVLHPLSYLIKKTNFQALKKFAKSYKLLDSLIISSKEFCKDSKGHFPIIIALYKRDNIGMDYEYIYNFSFKIRDRIVKNRRFSLSDFDYIGRYIDKYPNKNRAYSGDKVAMFYTLRDINALRRSKTFMQKENANTIYVTQDKYSLYCYVDVFKQMLGHIPYYLGNCDVMIDYEKFKDLEAEFVKASESKIVSSEILQYFRELLVVHYED